MTSALGFIFGGYRKVSPFFFTMRKVLTFLIFIIVLSTFCTRGVFAQNVAGASASIYSETDESAFDYRVQNLRRFLLKHNSPLAPYAEEFVIYADEYGLDYRLVPAISGVESTFGKHIPIGSYNAYGWANGDYKFTSWEDSIEHVSKTLKNSYIDRGVDSIYEIAKVYAPPSTTWGRNVSFFVKKIDTLPLNFDII